MRAAGRGKTGGEEQQKCEEKSTEKEILTQFEAAAMVESSVVVANVATVAILASFAVVARGEAEAVVAGVDAVKTAMDLPLIPEADGGEWRAALRLRGGQGRKATMEMAREWVEEDETANARECAADADAMGKDNGWRAASLSAQGPVP